MDSISGGKIVKFDFTRNNDWFFGFMLDRYSLEIQLGPVGFWIFWRHR